MKAFVVAVWMLLSIQLIHKVDAQGGPKKGVLKEVRACFAQNATETASCLSEYTECFNETTVDTVKTCVKDNGGRGDGVVKTCMEPHKTCLKEEAKAILSKIPQCIRSSLRELGKCFRKNAKTCASTCSEEDVSKSNPFKNLNPADLLFCDKFQESVMEPTCDALDCCSACLGEYENMMNCIVSDVLNMTASAISSDTCVVDCTASAADGSRKLDEVEEPTDDLIGEECAYYINVDGEQEGTASFKNIIREKIADSDFLACVTQESFAVADEQAKYDEENPDDNDSGATTDSILSASVLVIMGIMTIF